MLLNSASILHHVVTVAPQLLFHPLNSYVYWAVLGCGVAITVVSPIFNSFPLVVISLHHSANITQLLTLHESVFAHIVIVYLFVVDVNCAIYSAHVVTAVIDGSHVPLNSYVYCVVAVFVGVSVHVYAGVSPYATIHV